MKRIYLDPAQVPPVLRGGYDGKKFAVEICDRVCIPATAGLWDGGSREVYSALRMADGAGIALSDSYHAPWDAERREQTVTLRPGMVVVRHSISRGVDMGLVFFLLASDAAPLLPAPAEPLSRVQSLVLAYTAHRKSSYNGRDRYGMALDDWRYGYMSDKPATFPTRVEWDAAKADLAVRGLLTKAGAITPAGRNVAGSV